MLRMLRRIEKFSGIRDRLIDDGMQSINCHDLGAAVGSHSPGQQHGLEFHSPSSLGVAFPFGCIAWHGIYL
jgi:hypothetical protein